LEGWQGMEATIEKINTRYKTSKWSNYAEMSMLVDRIRNNTSESDLIETCSWDNQIVWRTGRLQSSRFTLIHPVGMESRTGYMPYQHEWRQELALSIAERKPKYVVLATKPREFIATVIGRPRDLLLEIPGFAEALATGYIHDTTIACYELYRRKD
ncbi:MAG TPA: hypothetical protein VFH43_02765, partial [Candidatus Kapabacteria bacterium]|nr:hypothetical protein [Candidatus Kapabacteria bacterium]